MSAPDTSPTTGVQEEVGDATHADRAHRHWRGCARRGGTGGIRSRAHISGFTPSHSLDQQQAEQRFQRAISANSIGRFSRTVSRRPQLIGSPGNRDAFNFSVQTLRSYGLRPQRHSYDVYISRPNKIQVTMTKPYRRDAAVKEKPPGSLIPGGAQRRAARPTSDVQRAASYKDGTVALVPAFP
jgi:hypothetical protein